MYRLYPSRRINPLAFGGSVLLLVVPLIAGEKIVDTENGFSLTLPDGFKPNEQLIGFTPNTIHAFVSGDPNGDELALILLIEKKRGTIGRDRLKATDFPQGSQAQLFTMTWQGFEVDGFEVSQRFSEHETITLNVQIPLKPAAIQLILVGPVDRKSELELLLKELLANLSGETNWVASAVPGPAGASSEHYGTVLVAVAVVIILVGLILLFVVSRFAPRGTVLAIAAVIYFTGSTIGVVRIREVALLAGSMKMLGFAGGILGFVDLVRKQNPKDSGS